MLAGGEHQSSLLGPQTAGAGHPAGLPSRRGLVRWRRVAGWARSRCALAARCGASGRMAGGLLLVLLAAPAVGQDLGGTWRGAYQCAQGNTALALTIEPRKGGALGALFHFEAAADNPDVPTGCFEMEGRFDPATGQVELSPLRWLLRPKDYVMVGLVGRLTGPGNRIQGQVRGPGCTAFVLERAPGPPAGAACRSGAPLLSLR